MKESKLALLLCITLVAMMLVSVIGCAKPAPAPAPTPAPAPAPAPSPAPAPAPSPAMRRTGPTPAPEWFKLESTATLTKQVFMPGDTVDFQLNLTNKDTAAGVISPFPPAIIILMPSLPASGVLAREREVERTVWSLNAGNEELTLQPGETKTAHFSWDQKKSDGGQAVPGWYQIVVNPTGWKASHPGQEKGLSHGYASFLIQYPQGAMQKTILVNQTSTVSDLHIKWIRADGSIGYDYIVDVAITLERIELTELGTKFYVLVTSPNNPLPDYWNPWFAHLPQAEYILDGVTKDIGTATGNFPADGARLVWGPALDPVPNDAKELVFRINQYGEWEGPWEFRVSLQ